MACCMFKGCFNMSIPFSTVAFFNLPKDEPRRGLWLKLSGNEEVQNLPANARRLVCQDHFEERHLRRQFNRTTLYRDAVPMDYRVRKGDASVNEPQKDKEKVQIKEKPPKTNKDEALVTNQEEIQVIPVDEESEYEVMVEEMFCEESESMEEANEDHETHLVDVEEVSEEHVVTESNQNDKALDDSSQGSDELIETFTIDDEGSFEEETENSGHESQEKRSNVTPRVSQSETSLTNDHNTDEQAQASIKAIVIEETEPNETQEVSNRKKKTTVVNTAKQKLPTNVLPSQPAKRLKHEEMVEPDTSSVSAGRVKAVTEQPSTSRCTSSVTVVPAASAPSEKMSEEEYFALSLVGPLQRLPPEKRAIAKMKILTYLVQLECGLTDANL